MVYVKSRLFSTMATALVGGALVLSGSLTAQAVEPPAVASIPNSMFYDNNYEVTNSSHDTLTFVSSSSGTLGFLQEPPRKIDPYGNGNFVTKAVIGEPDHASVVYQNSRGELITISADVLLNENKYINNSSCNPSSICAVSAFPS